MSSLLQTKAVFAAFLVLGYAAPSAAQPPEPPSLPQAPAPENAPAAPAPPLGEAPAEPAPTDAAPAVAPQAPAAPSTPAPPAEAPEAAPLPPENEPVEPAPGPAPAKSKPFELLSDDGAFALSLGAIVHADARFFLAGTGTDTFALRRVRPSLQGHVFRYFEYRVYPDFAGGRLQILDAWGNLHFIDEAQLMVGKGKPPVGLERLQSPADITFAERGFPTLLVPNRDVGVKLHGSLFKGLIEYAVGVYNGVPDGASGDVDENNEKDIAGRLFIQPFVTTDIAPLAGLGFGIAATRGTQSGAPPTHRSAGQEEFFAFGDTVTADGERVLFTPQAYYYFGPLGVLAEYVRVEERTNDGTVANEMTSEAWQVGGSVVLYGGKPSYKGVKVDRALDPETGGLGAFEVGARYGELHISSDVFGAGHADPAASADRASAWAGMFAWHFATRVKALAHYERTTFRRGAPGGDRPSESLLVARLQVAF